MAKQKTDPFQATADLIANALGTAKIFGENPRITRLVASSVGRFAAELDKDEDAEPGATLVSFALDRISDEDALVVPRLYASLKELAAG